MDPNQLQVDTGAPQYSVVSPEPSSMILLGTGALGAFGVLRRRLVSRPETC